MPDWCGAILIADDHPLFRGALKQVIVNAYPDATLLEAADIPRVQQLLSQHGEVELLLLDLHMPGALGFSALAYVVGNYPNCATIVVSANTHPETVRRALDYGAAGFLSKSASIAEIEQAISGVRAGQVVAPEASQNVSRGLDLAALDVSAAVARLTPQQFRVASMLVEGLLNKQIAYELAVTEATVKAHMTEIFKKLGVHSRTQAVLALHSLGVDLPSALSSPP
jgi:DNA-binding NarL/FixJ family response regulator